MSNPFHPLTIRAWRLACLSLAALVSAPLLAGNTPQPANPGRMHILRDFFGITDSGQMDYPLDTVMQGCPRVDCIPSIDSPRFRRANTVDYLRDDDLVLAISHAGQTRVYPARILQRHEIVNDRLGDLPVAVTYCPLCGTGEVFDRRVNGRERHFAVSGLLHGSDLIMYDREGKNLWQQITGTAFAGPERGQVLTRVPVVMTEWKNWHKAHPQSLVLEPDSTELKDLYAAYRASHRVMYGGKTNRRLPPKAVVYGLEQGNESLAVSEELLKKKGQLDFQLAGHSWQIKRSADGQVTVSEQGGQGTLQPRRAYWFAWYTFHPQTRVLRKL